MISYRAVIYMVLSALCFTIVNTMVKQVEHLPTFELVFFRSFGSALCCYWILTAKKIPILGNNKKWLLLRGVIGFISLSLFFRAIQMMPLGTAVSLRYLSPFFASGLAVLFLGERMKNVQWIFFILAFASVAFLKGFDARITYGALGIVLASAMTSGTVYVIIRKIGKSEHPVVIVNYLMSTSCLAAGLITLFIWIPPVGIEWLLVLAMGLFGFLAQLCMTIALQLEEANVVTPFKYTEVIFTILLAWFFFGEYQSVLAILAIGVIIISLISNLLVKSYYNRIETNSTANGNGKIGGK